MPQAIGYARVSTHKQVQFGVGLEAQERAIREFCKVQGYALAALYTDRGMSGKDFVRRDGAQAAILTACETQSVLVVYSLSRISRSTVDVVQLVETLMKAGASIASVTESIDTTTAAGRAFIGIVGVLGQLERELASERTLTSPGNRRTAG